MNSGVSELLGNLSGYIEYVKLKKTWEVDVKKAINIFAHA